MSHTQKGNELNATETALMLSLQNLGISGANQAIAKIGPTEFANVTAGEGSGTVTGSGDIRQLAVWGSASGLLGFAGLNYNDSVGLGIGKTASFKLDVLGSASSGVNAVAKFVSGTGTATGGLFIGNTDANYGAIWAASVTPSATNYALEARDTTTYINGAISVGYRISDTIRYLIQETTSVYSPATLTSSASDVAWTLNQTWNTSGTPTAIKVNITNTASNASSNLMDLQVGGVSKFSVSIGGGVSSPNFFTAPIGGYDTLQTYNGGTTILTIGARNYSSSGTMVQIPNATFTHTSGIGTALLINPNYTVASGNSTLRPLSIIYTINATGTTSGATSTGIFLNATETSLTGTTHNLMDLQVGGASKFSVSNTGLTSSVGAFSTAQIQVFGSTYSNVNAGFAVGNSGSSASNGTYRGFYDSRGILPASGTPVYNSYESVVNFIPTGGGGAFTAFLADPIINQTGGANGITRGLYVNPTLTSAADFRAIDVAAGRVLVGVAPTASANYGTVSVGGGAFDGSTTGKFVGGASGTSLAINEVSGYAGSLIDAQIAGVGQFKLVGNASGGIISSLYYVYATAFSFNAGGGEFRASSDGVWKMLNNAGTSFGRLQFGGTTSSFPSLKRDNATLRVRLADDSADAPIAIGNTVAAAVGIASTHKVTIDINGTTYYLLATNV